MNKVRELISSYWLAGTFVSFLLIVSLCLFFGTFVPLVLAMTASAVLFIIWRPLVGFCVLTFMIPLEAMTLMLPSFTLIKLIGIVTLWGWLANLLMGKKMAKFSAFFPLLGLYFMWCALSFAWSIQPDETWQRVNTLAQLLALVILGYNLIDTKKEFNLVLVCYLLGAVVSAGLGIYNGYASEFTARATICELQNPNYFARVLVIGFIFAVYLLFIYKSFFPRSLLLASCAPLLFATLLTGSRGAWLAVILTGLIMVTLFVRQWVRHVINPPVTAAIVIFVLTAAIFTPFLIKHVPSVVAMRADTSIAEDRGSGRLDIWLVGLEIIKDNYLKGVGLDAFPYAYTKYFYDVEDIRREIGVNKNPHNIFVATVAELGLPGIILFLLLFLHLWKLGDHSENIADSILCKCLILFILIAGLTGANQHRKVFWFVMMIPPVIAQFGILKGVTEEAAKQKICFLSPFFPNRYNPNYGIFAFRLVQSLRAAGVSVSVVAPVPAAPLFLWFNKKWRMMGRIPWKENIDGVDIIHPRYLCLPGEQSDKWNSIFMYWTVYPAVKILHHRVSFDIIHSYGLMPAGVVGQSVAKKIDVLSVCTAIGADINISAFKARPVSTRIKQALDNSDKVVAVGMGLAVKIGMLRRSGERATVIYNGVDREVFDTTEINRSHAKQKIGFQSGDRIILFVGRMIKQKGIYELVEVFSRIHNKFSDLYLVMVGAGMETESIIRLVREKGIGDKVFLIGSVPHKDLVWCYAASEVVVLLSRHDGVPNVIKEAMSCGRPVVATKAAGIPELVVDGKSGLLVEPENIEQATAALEKILSNPERARQMGMYGRELVQSGDLDWKMTAQSYQRLYEELITKKETGV